MDGRGRKREAVMRNRAFGRGNDVDGVTAMDCRSVTEGWKLTARGASRGRDGRRAQALALAARPTAGQCCLVIWILVETLIAGIIYARTGVRCREGSWKTAILAVVLYHRDDDSLARHPPAV